MDAGIGIAAGCEPVDAGMGTAGRGILQGVVSLWMQE